MNAFSRCLLLAPSTHPEIQGCSPPDTPAPWWLGLLATSTVCWLSQPTVSGHLLNLFSTRLLLTRPTLPHPERPATFLHTTTWLSFKGEGAPSLLQHNRPFLPLADSAAANNGTQSAARKARESHSSSNSLKHQYILFHSSLPFVLIIERSAWNRIALGFHGRRLWLMKRERLFVAFSWRHPAFLLSTNRHQSCWKSSYFL